MDLLRYKSARGQDPDETIRLLSEDELDAATSVRRPWPDASAGICVEEGWVFFETTSPSRTVQYGVAYSLYRMNTDGSDLELLSQSE